MKQREDIGILERCRCEYMGKKPLSRRDDLAFRRGQGSCHVGINYVKHPGDA